MIGGFLPAGNRQETPFGTVRKTYVAGFAWFDCMV